MLYSGGGRKAVLYQKGVSILLNEFPSELEVEGNFFRFLIEGVVVTEDGCTVEPDGVCPHEFKSPLLIAGVL